jgi:hypothetical protein
VDKEIERCKKEKEREEKEERKELMLFIASYQYQPDTFCCT